MKRLFWINRSSYNFSYSLYAVTICYCLGLSHSAKADWLSVCDNSFKPTQASFQKKYYKSNGDVFWLSLSRHVSREVADNCDIKELVDLNEKPQWMDLISGDVANALGDRVVLQGVKSEGQINISEIIPQNNIESQKRLNSQIPINVNLIGELKFRAFGVEERAFINRKPEGLIVRCKKGKKPAGVLLNPPEPYLTDGIEANLSLHYRADAGVKVAVADQLRFDKGAPVILGELPSTMKLMKKRFFIPERINRNSPVYLTLICPHHDAVLQLEDLRLIPKTHVQVSKKRSMWFWRPALWQKASVKLLAQAEKYNARRVFVSIELDEKNKKIKQKPALVKFIEAATAKQVEVWVVEGDPRVVLPIDRIRFVERSKIYSKFNAAQPKALRLKGIQYDIEPYLIAGYSIEVRRWLQAYVDTIAQLHQVSNTPLEVVIPFWWGDQILDGKLLLDHLVPYVESVNVMNYRTSQNLLERFAQPIFDWGNRNHRKVSMALEVGKLVKEQQWRFNKAKVGELWQIQVKGHHVLIYLNKAMRNSDAHVFSFSSSRSLSVDAITFKSKMPQLHRILPNLERSWMNWPSFSGISLHGLDDL